VPPRHLFRTMRDMHCGAGRSRSRLSAILLLGMACVSTDADFRLCAQTANSPTASSTRVGVLKKVAITSLKDVVAIEISASPPFNPEVVRLTGPDRLVIDFPGYELSGGNRRIPVHGGSVWQIRTSLFQVSPPIARVVVDSRKPVDFEIKSTENKLVIEIAVAGSANLSASTTEVPVRRAPSDKETSSGAETELPNRPRAALATRSAESRSSAYALQSQALKLRLQDLDALEKKSEGGDPEAQTLLALAYHDAVLLRRDDEEALKLLQKAAVRKFMAAQESLGNFAQAGIGTGKPAPVEALDWYMKAAEQGSLDAATNIALMYANGAGIPQDLTQATSWFRKAAEAGDATAQYNLALIYGRGNGVPQDYKESVRWLTAAADQNVTPALLDLGAFYMHPPDGSAADVDRGIAHYQRAADLGSARGQAMLGNIYSNGVKGKPDFERAVKWYTLSVEKGDRDGEFGLGVRYVLGEGVAVDLAQARRLFKAAADQGQGDAQYNFASMCEEGRGGDQDPTLALRYYRLAAEQGVGEAQFHLGSWLLKHAESPDDRIFGYMWLALSRPSVAESGAAIDEAKKSLGESEIGEGDRRAESWKSSHGRTHP
jgi:TPR repeat protein